MTAVGADYPGTSPFGDQVTIEPEVLPGGSGAPGDGRRLFGTFAYLVGKQGVTAALGVAFWALAARVLPARDVGLAGAASSIATLVATIGALGVGTLLLAEIGETAQEDRGPMLTTGIVLSTGAVAVLAATAVAASPLLGASLRAVGGDPVTATLFVVGAMSTAVCGTFDNAAIGLHRGSAQLVRATVASLIKVAFLGAAIALGVRTTAGLLFAWCASLGLSYVACVRLLRLSPARVGVRRATDLVRRWGGASLAHHVLNLALSSVGYVLPVIAALAVAPGDMAYFTTALLVAGTLNLLPYFLTLSLFAETTGDAALLRRNVRRTLPIAFAASAAIALSVEVCAPLALRVFGPAYAAHGTVVLRLLVLAGLPYVMKDHYVAIRRAQRRLNDAVRVIAVGTAFEVGCAVLGAALHGLDGLCLCWVVATACLGLAVTPVVAGTVSERTAHRT
jgi:O-antigen/teichoic acid export membrane protein